MTLAAIVTEAHHDIRHRHDALARTRTRTRAPDRGFRQRRHVSSGCLWLPVANEFPASSSAQEDSGVQGEQRGPARVHRGGGLSPTARQELDRLLFLRQRREPRGCDGRGGLITPQELAAPPVVQWRPLFLRSRDALRVSAADGRTVRSR